MVSLQTRRGIKAIPTLSDIEEGINSIHAIVERSKEVRDFEKGYIVIPEMKRRSYSPQNANRDSHRYAQSKKFEQKNARFTLQRMFNKGLFTDAIDPVDVIFSIGESGIEYGETVAEEYARMKTDLPHVPLIPIRKIGLSERKTTYGSVKRKKIFSFTKDQYMHFGIPVFSKQACAALFHQKVKKENKTDSRYRYHALVVDDVFAYGNSACGIIEGIQVFNPQIKVVGVVAIMGKSFQGGEVRIQKEFGIPTFAPTRFSRVDTVRKTFGIATGSESMLIRLLTSV